MAQMPGGYGEQLRQTDEHGNPVHHTDPMGGSGTMTGSAATHELEHGRRHGTEPHAMGTDAAAAGVGGGQGVLRRSGSSSSSSSEDDGQGGRRKKGLMGKVKEKLPGGHEKTETGHTTQTGYEGGQMGQEHVEKKGMMEKIKEKLPGQTTETGYGGGQMGQEHEEKKGMMEKIKEKLPGGGHP